MVVLYTERERKLRQITKEEENEKKKAELAVRIKRRNDVIAQVIFTESVLTFIDATNVVILTSHNFSIHFYTDLILDSSIRISFTMS